jgi:hypothetical protein
MSSESRLLPLYSIQGMALTDSEAGLQDYLQDSSETVTGLSAAAAGWQALEKTRLLGVAAGFDMRSTGWVDHSTSLIGKQRSCLHGPSSGLLARQTA